MFSTPRRRTLGWTLLSVCVAVFILGTVSTLAAVRQTQIEGTPTGRKLLKASDRILDCTEPAGQCYKDSQERTAKAVGDINRVVVLAAACSVGLDPDMSVVKRQAEIQSCVIDRLSSSTDGP